MDSCSYCGSTTHPTGGHELVALLARQNELLAVMAHVLEPKRYRLVQEALEDGTGKATAIFPSFPGGVDKLWTIERKLVSTNSTGTPSVGVYIMEGLPPGVSLSTSPMVVPVLNARDLQDWTNLPTVADSDVAPLLVKGGENVIFQWAGLSGGARCVARVQYRQAWQAID